MYLIKKISHGAVIFLLTSELSFAMAVGAYTGIQVGQSNSHNGTANVQTGTRPPTVAVRPKNTGMAVRLFAGYQFNDYGAFEFGYTHFAPSSYDPGVANNLAGTPQARVNGVDILGKAIWPFSYGLSVFGKAGFTIARASQSGSLAPIGSTTSSSTSLRPTFAVGGSYDINQSFQTDLSYTQIMSGGGVPSIGFIALSLSYHFVDKYCGQFLC